MSIEVTEFARERSGDIALTKPLLRCLDKLDMTIVYLYLV